MDTLAVFMAWFLLTPRQAPMPRHYEEFRKYPEHAEPDRRAPFAKDREIRRLEHRRAADFYERLDRVVSRDQWLCSHSGVTAWAIGRTVATRTVRTGTR